MKTIASHLYNSSALYSRHSRFIGGLAFSVAALGGAQDALALPQGAQTVSGQIAVSQPASNQLIVNQGSDKAIINWQSFDILNGESTRFVQPSSGSVALNRITNGNPTQILGQLSANGHLMVVNPNGVFFGPSSHVDVAGLVASTADISNANFLAGHYVFDKPGKPDASIVNKGLITAAEGGLVAMVAPGVENDGVISAKLGTVALGAGQTFTLDLYGDNLYSFAVGQKATAKAKDQDGNVLPAAIVNTGTISAEGGTIYMTARAAKEVVDQAINTTGIVEATASREIGGEIVLDGGEGAVSISGTLDVSGKKAGQKGGKIKVTSSKIDLAGSLDASGDAAGGTVLVGYDSRNPGSMTKADSVTVKQGALIDVSSANGTGGYAEVSGNSVALPSGQFFKAAGPQGDGTLVLDPGDFTIGTSGSGNDYWNNIDLANNLNGGNITIDTNGGNATNGNPPNIYVYAPVNWNGSGSLTLSAGHDIDVNANIVSTWSHGSGAQGGITMTADTDGSGGSINIGNANWFSVAGVQVSTVNGNITLTAKGTSSDNVNIGSSAFLGGGKTKVQTGSGTLDIEAGSQINIGSTATFGGDTNVGTVSGNLFLTSNEGGSGGDINIFASPISGISHVYSTSGAISLQANGSDLIMNTNAGNLGDASVFSTGSASNIEVYANNVTLTGGATISAGNDLQLNNTGVFSSDTKFVLSGLNVALNQNVGGSIQNAIDAINPSSGTGTVTLGDGTWTENVSLDGNILDPGYNMAHDFTLTSLHGAGSTTIQDNSGGTSPVISVANGSNDTISNLTVEGHNGTYAPAGIAVTNTNGIAITGNTVQDVDGAAISVDPSSNVTIQSNIVYDAWTGISVSGLTGTNLIDSNAIDNISFDAIDASGNTGLTISNNQIGNQGAKLIGGAGIYVSGDDDVTISANTVNHAVTGITVTGLTDSSGLGNNLISGNTVDYVSGDGIDASYSTGLNITGNFIGQNGSVSGTGISLYNSNFAQVTNNQINGAPTGISVAEDTGLDNEGSHDINITGNTISNASTGITADETYNLNINDNTLTGITGTGIAITDSEGEGASGGDNYNININGNTITGSAGAVGIDVANASGVTIGSVNALQLGPIGDQDGHDFDGDADDFSNIISGFATGIKVTGGNTVSVAYNSVDPGTTGISVDHSAFVTVDTNTVNGFNTGISATSSDTVAVTNNTVTNSGTGIYVNSLTDSIGSGNQVAGNQIDFTTGDAIDAYSSANLWIGNNLIGQNGGGIGVYGIYVNQLSNGIGGNSSVTGNTIDNTGNNAIYASFDTNLAINNNVIGTHGGANNIGTGGYANGIVVYRDDDVNVNGNTVQNVQGGSGIVVDSLTDLGGNGNYIIGNNIDFVVGDGIDALSNASGSVNLGISGNQIGQNGGGIGGYGIYATGLTYDSAGNSSITGNTIDNTDGDGIRTSYDNQLAINGNYIGTVAGAGSIGGDGINSYWETNINIDNNHIQNTAAYGILAQYLWDFSGAGNNILGNTIDFTVYDGIYANYGYNVGIGNSQIGQNGGGIGGNGITVLNLFADLAGNSSVTNNVIDNTTYDGINAAYDQYLAINGNQIGTNAGNIGGNGISVFDDSALTVYNNTVHNTTGGGIVVDLLYGTYGGNVIDTNYVESTGGNGISASNSGPLTISNNQIGQNGSGSITGDGIHAENDYNVQITGNQVDPVGDGIYVSGSDYAYIYNNEVKHASLNGIEVNNSYNPTIDSNGVFRNSGDGILVEGDSSSAQITNNTVAHNHEGIVVDGSYAPYVYNNGVFHDAVGIDITDGSTYADVLWNNVKHAGTDILVEGGSDHAHVKYNTVGKAGTGIEVDGSEHVHLYNNWIDHVGTGVLVQDYSNHAHVSQNYITNADTGIDVENSGWAHLWHNFVDGISGDGIFVNNSWDTRIVDNQIGNYSAYSIGGNGINVQNSNGETIQYNTVNNTALDGITVSGLGFDWSGNGNLIYSNYVDYTGGNGISAYNSGGWNGSNYALTIDSNQIGQAGSTSITGDGIHVEDSAYAQITGNQVDPVGDGIYVSGSDYAYIYNNEVKHASLNGIEVNNSYNPTIDSNGIFRNSGDGILVEGGSSSAQITNNTVAHNHEGIVVDGSDYAYVYNNGVFHDAVGIDITDESYRATVESNNVKHAFEDILVEGGSNYAHVKYNDVGKAGFGIVVDGSQHAHVYDNDISHVGTGVFVTDADHTHVAANDITHAGTGVDVENSDRVHVWNNTIDGIGGDAIYGTGDGNLRIADNQIGTSGINNVSGDGVHVESSSNVTVKNNDVENIGGDGIALYDVSTASVNNNYVYNISGTGIEVSSGVFGSSDITIQDNNIFSASTGISVSGLTGTNLIDSNTIDYISGDGIDVANSNAVTASNNSIGTGFFGSIGGNGIDVTNSSAVIINSNSIGTGFLSSIGGTGIVVDPSSDITISGNTIQNALTGISVSDLTGTNLISGNIIGNIANDAVDVLNSNNVTISGNSIGTIGAGSVTKDGINESGSDQVVIAADIIGTGGVGSIGGTGIFVDPSSNITISGNTIQNASTGINVSGLTGINQISGNTIGSIANDAVDVLNSINVTISGNSIGTAGAGSIGGTGIFVDPSSNITISGNTIQNASTGINVSGLTGINQISGNSIDFIANDGIDAANSANLTISNNSIGTAGAGSIGGTGIFVDPSVNVSITGNTVQNAATGISVSDLSGSNAVSGNTVDFIANNGIDIIDSANVTVSGNLVGTAGVGSIGGTGIFVDPSANISITGNTVQNAATGIDVRGLSGNNVISGNIIDFITNNGIDAANSANVAINTNFIGTGGANSIGNTGINAFTVTGLTLNGNTIQNSVLGINIGNSAAATVTGNMLNGNANGIEVVGSNGVQFASNTIVGNGDSTGFGVLVQNSDSVSFLGDKILAYLVGIRLDNAQNASLDTMTLDNDIFALVAQNNSGGLTVANSEFANDFAAVILDGPGTSMSFLGGGSRFSNITAYFVMADNAMQGQVLDASQQTFNGTRGADFSFAELTDAESRTLDAHLGLPTGIVFYRNLPGSTAGAPTFGSVLNQFLESRGTLFSGSIFSYAGQTIGSSVTDNIYNFRVQDVNLSLLAPGAAGGIPAGGATPQALNNLAPAAGGDDAAQLAELSPSAGGAGDCGNNFLGSGFSLNFDAGSCSSQ